MTKTPRSAAPLVVAAGGRRRAGAVIARRSRRCAPGGPGARPRGDLGPAVRPEPVLQRSAWKSAQQAALRVERGVGPREGGRAAGAQRPGRGWSVRSPSSVNGTASRWDPLRPTRTPTRRRDRRCLHHGVPRDLEPAGDRCTRGPDRAAGRPGGGRPAAAREVRHGQPGDQRHSPTPGSRWCRSAPSWSSRSPVWTSSSTTRASSGRPPPARTTVSANRRSSRRAAACSRCPTHRSCGWACWRRRASSRRPARRDDRAAQPPHRHQGRGGGGDPAPGAHDGPVPAADGSPGRTRRTSTRGLRRGSRRVVPTAPLGGPVRLEQAAERPRLRGCRRQAAPPTRRPQPSFLVVSASPGEGKTSTVAYTAFALAEADVPTLAVNADCRRPTLHRRLGVSRPSPASPTSRSTGSTDPRWTTSPSPARSMSCGSWPAATPARSTSELVGAVDQMLDVADEPRRDGRDRQLPTAGHRRRDGARAAGGPRHLRRPQRQDHPAAKRSRALEMLRLRDAPLLGCVCVGSAGTRRKYSYYESYYYHSTAEAPRAGDGAGARRAAARGMPPTPGGAPARTAPSTRPRRRSARGSAARRRHRTVDDAHRQAPGAGAEWPARTSAASGPSPSRGLRTARCRRAPDRARASAGTGPPTADAR